MGGLTMARRPDPPPTRDLMSILDQIDDLLVQLRDTLDDDKAGDDDHDE